MAAPVLDRRIVIETYAEVPGQVGESSRQIVSSRGAWASATSAGSVEIDDPSGVYVSEIKRFLIRWERALIDLLPGNIVVVDEYGRRFELSNVDELEATSQRRRYLALTGHEAGRCRLASRAGART